MTSTYDAIIVGARCAGSATAMLLARQGLRVLVLDRSRYGGDTVSTHALMRGGVLQLRRWGLLDRIQAAETPPVTRVVFHYPDDAVRVSLKPAAGVQALYAPRRTVLDRVLADAAVEASAEMRFRTRVTELTRQPSGRVTGVAGHDMHGQDFVAAAPLVIGADGVRSFVASSVGAPMIRTGSSATACLYGYWDDLPAEGFEWFYAPGVAAGLIPTNDGQTCLFVGTTRERMRVLRAAGTTAALSALLQQVSPDLWKRVCAARPPVRLRGFAGQHGYRRKAWGPGWALVGDAGAFEDPLSTHGITDAFRDAELLSAAVGDIHAGAASEAGALLGYQTARDRMAERLFGLADAIASCTWSMTELRRLLLEASSAMTEQVERLESLDALQEAGSGANWRIA